jgi:hypothetical protein
MSNIEESSRGLTVEKDASLTIGSNAKFDKKAYQRELMRKKRAAEKARRESENYRSGAVSGVGVVVEQSAEENVTAVNLTRTDAKFEADRPRYYIFGKEVKERDCWMCGKKYETRLELNKFCSPKCKNEWLDQAFGKLRVRE